jgi:hypothetical protein
MIMSWPGVGLQYWSGTLKKCDRQFSFRRDVREVTLAESGRVIRIDGEVSGGWRRHSAAQPPIDFSVAPGRDRSRGGSKVLRTRDASTASGGT